MGQPCREGGIQPLLPVQRAVSIRCAQSGCVVATLEADGVAAVICTVADLAVSMAPMTSAQMPKQATNNVPRITDSNFMRCLRDGPKALCCPWSNRRANQHPAPKALK